MRGAFFWGMSISAATFHPVPVAGEAVNLFGQSLAGAMDPDRYSVRC